MKTNSPKIIEGGLHQDNRGKIRFVNDFDFSDQKIKRFYFIDNCKVDSIRAWQAHRIESKYFYVVSGEFAIQTVYIDNWTKPSNKLDVQKYVLCDNDSSILYILSGYANGIKSLTPNSSMLVFSDRTLEESERDDFRFNKYMWSDWRV